MAATALATLVALAFAAAARAVEPSGSAEPPAAAAGVDPSPPPPAATADEHPGPAPEPPASPEAAPAPTLRPAPEPATPRLSFLLEAGAYYTSAGVYVPIARRAVPAMGEREEWEFWLALLPRSLLPQVVVLEASVNPMPCLGLLVRNQAPEFYELSGKIYPEVNLVRAATAGFDEPWAASLFMGSFADWGAAGRPDVKGNGYLGIVLSAGNWHIKDNVAIDDRWLEIEAKVKGDRRSSRKKLSWGFRLGVKLHEHGDILDGGYVELRRSRVDYEGGPRFLANSGVAYRFDVALDGRPLKHRFLVDRKWPTRGRIAVSLAVGMLWSSGLAYRGALGADGRDSFEFLLRPNVEF